MHRYVFLLFLSSFLSVETKSGYRQSRGSIPVLIDGMSHNFVFYFDDESTIETQALRFCAENVLLEKDKAHVIERRAKEYVDSLDHVHNYIEIVKPSFGGTIYSHETDPYVRIDMRLRSVGDWISDIPYEIQILTLKDKLMTMPFQKEMLQQDIVIYVSNELFGTYYVEIRILDPSTSRIVALDDCIFDVIPVSSPLTLSTTEASSSFSSSVSSLKNHKIVIVSDLGDNIDGTRRVTLQQIDALLHHDARVEILDTSESGRMGRLGQILQERFPNEINENALTFRHIPILVDSDVWRGSLATFDEKCISMGTESKLEDPLWDHLKLAHYWKTSNADALWITNSGIKDDGNATMIDLIAHLARVKGNVKHRYMDVAANGLDEPTRKYLRKIFQDPYPSITHIAVNSRPLASHIPELTYDLARVRMFQPAVNLTKFDLCKGICSELEEFDGNNEEDVFVRYEYLTKRCKTECSNQLNDDGNYDVDEDDNVVRILFLGRLMMAKGPGMLLKSISRLPSRLQSRVEIVLVGSGYLRHPLSSLAEHLNISSRVLISNGNVAHEVVPKVIASSDIFVFPSLYPEAFGIVCVEAMALGLPVVGFGFGGSSDFLHHMDTGLIASPPTPFRSFSFLGTSHREQTSPS